MRIQAETSEVKNKMPLHIESAVWYKRFYFIYLFNFVLVVNLGRQNDVKC